MSQEQYPTMQQTFLADMGVDVNLLPEEMKRQISAVFFLDGTKIHSPGDAPQPGVCLTLEQIQVHQMKMMQQGRG